jgi:transposase-like protein
MYSYEKKKAVEIFTQYDERFSAVKRELGYSNSKTSLRNWVREILNFLSKVPLNHE